MGMPSVAIQSTAVLLRGHLASLNFGRCGMKMRLQLLGEALAEV
jgi:hypothetical protein